MKHGSPWATQPGLTHTLSAFQSKQSTHLSSPPHLVPSVLHRVNIKVFRQPHLTPPPILTAWNLLVHLNGTPITSTASTELSLLLFKTGYGAKMWWGNSITFLATGTSESSWIYCWGEPCFPFCPLAPFSAAILPHRRKHKYMIREGKKQFQEGENNMMEKG